MANTLIGGVSLANTRKKRQPISFGGKGYDPRVGGGGVPKAPSAPGPRIGTAAGNAALNIAWAQANPGKVSPDGTITAKWGSPEAATVLSVLEQRAKGAQGGGSGGAGNGVAEAAQAATTPLADDAQAAAARAQAIFDATQKRAALVAQGTYSAADLDEAIRRLQGERPDAERNAKNNANSMGLTSSSYLAKNLDDIAANFVRQESDARNDYGRSETNRQAQLAAVAQQQQLAQAAIDAELADRQAQRDQAAAQAGALAPVSYPKQMTFADATKVYGLSVRQQGNTFVVVDRNGQVLPGAMLRIAGKKRYIVNPKGQ